MKKISFGGVTRLTVISSCILFIGGALLDPAGSASSAKSGKRFDQSGEPVVGRLAHFAETGPVRDLPEAALNSRGNGEVRSRFRVNGGREEREKNPKNSERVKKLIAKKTGKLEIARDEALSIEFPDAMPTPEVSFDGLSAADDGTYAGSISAPPDAVGDVGPNHYVQMTNTLVRVYNKSGVPLMNPFLLTAITGVAGGPCVHSNDGDPMVVYDPLADRWILSQFCVTDQNGNDLIPGHQVFAVSKTSDPTGAYYVYDFVMPNSDFHDYPHIGVWSDGYFMSTNEFNSAGTSYIGAGAFAFDRAKMLVGDPTATYIYFDESTSICPTCGGQLPTDLDGTVTPPTGMGNLFMEFRADEFGDPADALRIFEFKPDFAVPANSSFNQVGTDLVLASFNANAPSSRSIVEQPGTSVGLDPIADRLMHRLAYRNLGTTSSPVNSWVLNFTVNVGGVTSPTSAATYQAGIRWAELRRSGSAGSLLVNQQGTQSSNPGNPAGGTNLWMGSIAQDNQGNIFLGYSSSGSTDPTDFPSIKYSGRLSSDPSGTMGQGQGVGMLGTGYQSGAQSRWGDYSAASVDPSDECSFWYTQEYRTSAQNGSPFNWNTRIIGGVRFPGCTSPQRGSISGSVTGCSSGLPFPNAIVTLPGGFLAVTSATGQYLLINVPAGTTSVTATAAGVGSATNPSVIVLAGANNTVNLCINGSPIATPTPTPTFTPTPTPTFTPTPTPTFTPTPTPTFTPTPTPTFTPTPTPTFTPTPTPTFTPTPTPTFTPTPTPTFTPTPTPTFTPTPTPGGGFEGDVAPRFAGDGALLSNDITIIRQFVAGNAVPDQGFNEFQRADTAPALTRGDGLLTAGDVIQARRYVAGIDPLQAADGPLSAPAGSLSPAMGGEFSPSAERRAARRSVYTSSRTAVSKGILEVPVRLRSAGGETAIAFTLQFDPSVLSDPKLSLGNSVSEGAVLTVNESRVTDGKLAVLIDSGSSLMAAGSDADLVKIEFSVAQSVSGRRTKLRFSSDVAAASVVDARGTELPAQFLDSEAVVTQYAEVSGRVTAPTGRGLKGSVVSITAEDGTIRRALTDSMGYFSFPELPIGLTYVISVSSKNYRFPKRSILLSDSLTTIDLVANE